MAPRELAHPLTAEGSKPRRRMLLVLGVGAVLTLHAMSPWGLWGRDEGRYANISQEMLDRGDFVTPRMDGVVFLDKPPLVYWVTAASLAVWGINEWGARFGQILFAIGTLAIVWAIGRELFDRRRALIAVLVLASSVGFFAGAHLLTLDLGLAFFVTLALWTFLVGYRSGAGGRWWYVGMFAAMAAGMLTKGLPGVVLPCASIAAFLALRDGWRSLRDWPWVLGPLVFLAIAGPWFAAISWRHPEFLSYFFLHEHLARFATGVHHRGGGWWYYAVVLGVGLLPWSLALPASLLRRRRAPANLSRLRTMSEGPAFLLSWFVPGLLIFTIAQSKLPLYALPLYPAAALAIASLLDRAMEDAAFHRLGLLLPSILFATLAAAGVYAWLRHGAWTIRETAAVGVHLVAPAAGALAVAFLGAYLLARRRRFVRGLALLACVCTAATYGVFASVGRVNFLNETSYFARVLASERQPGGKVFTYRCYLHGLPFYLRTPVGMVGYNEDEVKVGRLDLDGSESFVEKPEFLKELTGDARAFAVVPHEDLPRLQKRTGRTLFVLARSERLDLVSNRLGPEEKREIAETLGGTPIDLAAAGVRARALVPGGAIRLVEIERQDGRLVLTLQMNREEKRLEVVFPLEGGEPAVRAADDVFEETGREDHLLRMVPPKDADVALPEGIFAPARS